MTPRAPRDLIVLSDGTGNSSAKPFKTNVWRLYQALNLRDGSQVAVFGDGVGNSSISFLRVLGLALGIGVKRNVVNLYKFLCRNYWRDPADPTRRDRIWMFGFSRGAFTIRVLAGLVHSQGLVTFETETDLDRHAVAAYRAFRREAFRPRPWVVWVRIGRFIRDILVWGWEKATKGTPYQYVHRQADIDIHFMGVWDTVAAYGLPIDELTIAVDKWVWPMKFEDTSLLPRVRHARHALALDDERRTFHPIPWDEHAERKAHGGRVDPDRLTQVWFPGMHADVGGGYPDDGLSFVSLCWMLDEAGRAGLRFEEAIVDTYRALASPTGRLYDSRRGIGALWRYQPRNVQFLMDNSDDTVPVDQRITPLVHHCVVTRMAYGSDGYAPKALPFRIDVLLPNNRRVPFDGAAVATELARTGDAPSRMVLADLAKQRETAPKPPRRGHLFALVLDTIWLRRAVYFVTLGLGLCALAYPVLHAALDWGDRTAKINQVTGSAVTGLVKLVKGMVPSYASPWIDAISANPQAAVNILLLLVASLLVSAFLERRIRDRARAAWNVQPTAGGEEIQRLRLAGQRHALLAAAIVLGAVAYGSHGNWKSFWLAALGAAASLVLFLARRTTPKIVDPENPPVALGIARWFRNSPRAVHVYRWAARTGFPAVFLLAIGWVVVSGVNLGIYGLRSTLGAFCETDAIDPGVTEAQREEAQRYWASHDRLGTATVDISQPCARTRLWLVAGRQYRIKLEPGWAEARPGTFEKRAEYAWFDKGIPADVAGFGANEPAHRVAASWRRWWRENYFEPIARVGNIGNYEYPLKPASPLPKVDLAACGKAEAPSDIRSPAPLAERERILGCEAERKIKRNEVLISDVTPDATGELYIYVNDVVWFWESRDDHRFYRNNSGKAKVTVTRTLAPAVRDAP